VLTPAPVINFEVISTSAAEKPSRERLTDEDKDTLSPGARTRRRRPLKHGDESKAKQDTAKVELTEPDPINSITAPLDVWEPTPEIPSSIRSHEDAHLNDAGDTLFIDVCVECRATVKAHYCDDLKKEQQVLWTNAQGLNKTLLNSLAESARVGKIIREARDKANQVPDPYQLLPDELKGLERFGLYRSVWNDKKKRNDKPPYNARTHEKGNPIDAKDRSTYDVIKKVLAVDTRYQGGGFGLQYSDGYTCTDFDHCVNAAGVIDPRIQKILDETGSYSEFSPSGDGVHLWTKGWRVPWDGTEKGTQGCKIGNAEMYSGKHYMTLTGKHVPSTPLTIESRDVSALYARICAGEFKAASAPAAAPLSTSAKPVQEQREKRRVVNDGSSNIITKPLELFMNGFIDETVGFTVRDEHGNSLQPPYDSQSEADAGLVTLLMFEHNGNEELVDADFRKSALMREKWERADYRKDTFDFVRPTYKKHEAARLANPTVADAVEDSDYDDSVDEVQEPLPEFPKMTGSLADLCHAVCPDIPFEYKFAAALAYFGLFRSGIDVLATEPFLQTRFYMSLIGLPWRGKTAALKEIRKIMPALYGGKDFARAVSVDSGPALVEQLYLAQRRQIIPLNPITDGADKLTPRVAMMVDPDEMSDLFEKGKVTANSKNSIFSEFLKLYDGNETENTTKKSGKQYVPNAQVAFIAGATVQGYPLLWNCTGASASGLISRWTPIGTNAGKMPIEQRPTDGDKTAIAAQRITNQLKHPGRKIQFTPDAARVLREWSALAPEDETSQAAQARVEDMVKKLLIVLASSNDRDEIGTDLVSLGIQFGDYITTLRERYNPLDSWSQIQAFENIIETTIKKNKGRMMSNKLLLNTVKPQRKPGGYGAFNQAISNLLKAGRLRIVTLQGSNAKHWKLSGG
jgi:hypothetical protein